LKKPKRLFHRYDFIKFEIGDHMVRTRKVKSGAELRHTRSNYHNPNEIQRWKDITGKKFQCCLKKSAGVILRGPNKGNKLNDCGKGQVGAHVKFKNSNGMFIVPVCNKHNDSAYSVFDPGDWFLSNITVAVPAKSNRNPKRKNKSNKRRKSNSSRKVKICSKPVKGRGRCHLHKNKKKGRKRVRKGICGAKLK
jgi:hypothetical protein